MNSNPLISVAVCTYNRADRLIFTLEGLCCQSLPIEQFEVLVVDNASTDNTQEICKTFATKLPNFHYIYEPVQGLSKARNTALHQARGEYLAYLDDDAIPCENWLETILQTFQTVEPKPVCVGGLISPLWEIPKPDWVHEYIEPLFSILDYGSQPCWFSYPKFPYGANMTYRREALCQLGGFSEQLGRQGKNLLSEEERLLNRLLEKQGERFYYNPQASVQHWIPKERINPVWIIRRSYWQGRSEALVDQILGKSFTQQRWNSIWTVMNWMNLRRLVAQVLPDPKIRIKTRVWLAWSWGYFSQAWFQ
ncbi:MAG: glycosyltransferase [Kastovskya adunca ATA6-11-RM4]|jgi:glycosyltransferase involved in cell wall biosynthesis|nr:glycosyltransferase [Kastovskya adunca ATA6-11-RM4]